MSALYVRQLIEQWLADPAMTVPFYPTVNEEQNPADQIWCTASFGSPYREVMTYCENTVSEDGDIELIYFGPPGQGYAAVITAIETDMQTLMAMRDPNEKLVLTGRSAPLEFSGGSARKQYAASVFIDYEFYE